jgi:hypothetical protein
LCPFGLKDCKKVLEPKWQKHEKKFFQCEKSDKIYYLILVSDQKAVKIGSPQYAAMIS